MCLQNLKAIYAVATLAFALTLQSGPSQAAKAECDVPNSRLTAILKRGKLIAGVRFDYPPMGYVDQNGANAGFGPDIAREFAKHLGVELELVQTRSETRIPLLRNGTTDLDIGPTTPEKVRDEVVDFSYAYVWDRSTIVVRSGMSRKPQDYYQDSTSAVGAIQGSNFVGLWKKLAPNANMKLYQEYTDLMLALAQKKVDFIVISEVTAHQLLEKLGDRAKDLVVGEPYLSDPQAIILPENDSKWRDWVNWGLQRLWADGTFQILYKKHYKIDPPFHIWENGQLQPLVQTIGKNCDPW
jgi:polar amino acid transport system substrate-binding protein